MLKTLRLGLRLVSLSPPVSDCGTKREGRLLITCPGRPTPDDSSKMTATAAEGVMLELTSGRMGSQPSEEGEGRKS